MNAPVDHRAIAAVFRIDEASLRRRAAEAARLIIAQGAARMVAQPWRIARAVYGGLVLAEWPYRGRSATEVLADCSRAIRAEEARGRAGHWTHDVNRLVALRQAEDALLAIILEDAEPELPEAA
jgi:hypothetical protein